MFPQCRKCQGVAGLGRALRVQDEGGTELCGMLPLCQVCTLAANGTSSSGEVFLFHADVEKEKLMTSGT